MFTHPLNFFYFVDYYATQTKPKVQKNANIFTAAAQFCVEKAQAQPIRRLQELCGKPQG